jgi:hypothetical protein
MYTVQFSLSQPFLGVFQYNPNSATYSPDGLANYWLRAAPNVVAGLNSANVLNLSSVTLAPGSGQMFYLDPHQPTEKSMQWNLTFEKESRCAAGRALVGNRQPTRLRRLPRYLE